MKQKSKKPWFVEQVNTCTGCSACEAICPHGAITMEARADGFRYPIINRKACAECGKCLKRCPEVKPLQRAENPPRIYGTKNRDKEQLRSSTSGGMFEILAREVIGRGGVIFGVILTEDFRVIHTAVESLEQMERCKGSKYVQSSLEGCYKEIKQRLRQGQEVLFVGTPCQVAGVQRSFPKQESLTCVDLICHGVPSPLLWEKYLAELNRKGTLRSFQFRNKQLGWKHNSARYDLEGTLHYEAGLKNPYLRLYFSRCAMRTCCYSCQYANLKRVGDLTIGDYWGIERVNPAFEDQMGVSLLFVNSEKGEKLLQSTQNEMEMFESDSSLCLQPQLSHPVRSEEHESFSKDLITNDFPSLVARYAPELTPWQRRRRKLRRYLKRLLGGKK